MLCSHWLEVWAWYQKRSFISASQERYWKRGLIVISVFPLPACCVSLSFIKQPCVCLQMQDFTGHPLSARSPVTSRLPSILCHVFSVGSKKAAHPGQCRLASVSVCVAVRREPSPLANTWPAHLPGLHPSFAQSWAAFEEQCWEHSADLQIWSNGFTNTFRPANNVITTAADYVEDSLWGALRETLRHPWRC